MDEASQPLESPTSPAPRPSLMQRYRLYWLGLAVFVLLILFLLLGLQIGRLQKDFDRKALEQRIAFLQKSVQSGRDLIEEKHREQEKSLAELADKDLRLARLAEEMTTREKNLLACAASLSQAERALRPAASPTPVAEPTPQPYLRFGNRECTLVPGRGEQSWRECIENAKRKPKSAASSSAQK